MFLFALLTGARRDEIHIARVGDVRIGDGVVMIRTPKTEKGHKDSFRALAIHPDLLPVLIERTRERNPHEFIFPELENHSRNWPANEMARACRACGITYRRFHGLRHTFVTYLLASGADIVQVMAAAGHKKLETTQIYAHLAEKVADVSKIGI